mmetsp:Transcript_31739/g.99753  ORF Transcript_31739/g.99753 Transcript_31739/m.99753 type:complete len:176 (+) Transcript_31739:61-588(+)
MLGRLSRLRPAAAARSAARVSALRSAPRRGLASETYTEQQDKTGRPLSPHLTIYRLPMIAYSSITVRITGGIAYAYIVGVTALALFGGAGALEQAVQSLPEGGVTLPAAKFAVSWPFVYHWIGCVRHMVWDVFDVSSKSFTNSLMRTSSYGIFAATTAISLGLATLSLPKPAQKE